MEHADELGRGEHLRAERAGGRTKERRHRRSRRRVAPRMWETSRPPRRAREALAARARLPRARAFAAFSFPISVASSASTPHAAATPSFAIAAAVSSAVGRHESAKDSDADVAEVRRRVGTPHASAPEGSYPAAANSASLAPNAHSREDAGSVATRNSHRAVAGSSGRVAGRSGMRGPVAAAKASASHPLATTSRRTSARATVGSAPRRAAPFSAASTKGARSDGTGSGQSMGGANGSGAVAAPGARRGDERGVVEGSNSLGRVRGLVHHLAGERILNLGRPGADLATEGFRAG